MILKRGNKKAQENMPLDTVIALVLLVAFAVLALILYFNGSSIFSGGIYKLAAQDLQQVVSICQVNVNSDLTASYCSAPMRTKINEQDTVVTCTYSEITKLFDADTKAKLPIACPDAPEVVARGYCYDAQKPSTWNKARVNGQTCAQLFAIEKTKTCASITVGSYSAVNQADACSAGQLDITALVDSGTGKCCLRRA